MSPTQAQLQNQLNGRQQAKKHKTRVMLVEDHPLTRLGLAELIEKEADLELCAEAAGAAEALQRAGEANSEVIVVDLSLKEGSGLDLIKQIHAHDPEARMLVVSMHDETLFAERALQAGAMGYVRKQEAIDQVVEAVRKVQRGQIHLSGVMAERVLQRALRGEEETARPASPVARLSDRELQVYQLIGEGLSTRQIAERLHLSPKTVDTHREHLKRKLKLQTLNQLVRHAAQWVMEQA
jgi:DNA-binding NarL/FixJ family response regulator